MGFVGIEEIFLKVQDLERAVDFYHNKLDVPLDKRDHERAYLPCDRGHLVLQIANSTGRHQAGGPMHFTFTVTEETFERGRQEVCRFRVSDARADRPSGAVQRLGAIYLRSGRERDRSEHALPLSCSVALSTARPSGLAAARE
jgi:catechol 2,3-dioxygenase-like lactoylglutathione lyase family enzyme